MPFKCRYCGQPHCSIHRLPENHECRGLEDYKEQLREEGQLMAETPQVKVQREIREGPEAPRRTQRGFDLSTSQVMQSLEGRVTWMLLGLMVVVTVAGWIVNMGTGPGTGTWTRSLWTDHFALHPSFFLAPWTLVTSIFAHGGVSHLLLNGIVLFFFGPAVERRIGTRSFLTLFVASGIIAGLAQVAFSWAVAGTGLPFAPPAGTVPAVLGASGAILATMGVLAVLEPDATVLLFFVVPMPLWLLVAGFAAFDFVMLLTQSAGGIANLAHLAGLGIGIAAAKMYWDRPRHAVAERWGM